LGTTASSVRARITLPIHPRFGEEVVVQRSHGAGIVLVETQPAGHLMLPLEWTDLQPPAHLAAVYSGRTVHFAPEALRELAAWIEARGAEKSSEEVGHFDKWGESGDPDGEQRRSDASKAGKPRRSAATDGREQRHQPAAALVEQARSPDAARHRRHGDGRKRGRK
jgi:hypothetical protein